MHQYDLRICYFQNGLCLIIIVKDELLYIIFNFDRNYRNVNVDSRISLRNINFTVMSIVGKYLG